MEEVGVFHHVWKTVPLDRHVEKQHRNLESPGSATSSRWRGLDVIVVAMEIPMVAAEVQVLEMARMNLAEWKNAHHKHSSVSKPSKFFLHLGLLLEHRRWYQTENSRSNLFNASHATIQSVLFVPSHLLTVLFNTDTFLKSQLLLRESSETNVLNVQVALQNKPPFFMLFS